MLLAATRLSAQEKFRMLSGRVSDAGSQQPVIYANVQLKKGGIGTATNARGEFVFNIADRYWEDTLLISCIGYKTLAIPLPRGSRQDMDMQLEPAVYQLPAVSVNARSGLAIMQQMVSRIPENYDTADVRLTAFYRENICLAGDTINFNESVLDIYKTYHNNRDRKDQIRILKGRRKKVDWSKDPQLYNWIGNIMNTAYSSLNEDLQKYLDAKRNILNERNFRYYNCDYQETVQEGDRKLLVLSLQPKDNNRKAIVTAKLYIDESSLALVRCEIETTPAGIDYINAHQKGGIRYTIMSKVNKATFDFTRLTLVVTYKQYRNKTYLSTVARHWDCVVNSKKRGMHNVPWTGDFYLLVTGIDTEQADRFTSGVSNDKSSMNNEVGNEYDASFWENYNILLPVLPDALQADSVSQPAPVLKKVSNRQNGFTRADTLRGMLSPLRSCYDVRFYQLDVEVMPDSRSIRGSSKVRFAVKEPLQQLQLDLVC
ncbi:carboxypeptidase-like regulatory domain-containing protein [uncultured Chitinophaga sp.]|uniref:carboxypeptidase-like regulatory domain-containing protein n=1 Tax=uncultured Chitinophaga sp. TaxID=339340 RepID=UPI002614659A|nr:carboxypeptidase-like regulatory domain-containing protein [uncultured Chitinophaga sp.]